MPEVISNNLDLWSSAILTKSTAGRGSNGKQEAYGIKKLRELILELAVRGKLVPQDPNDEPASVLLKKIAAEKARLTKEGALSKQKPLPEIADDEKYFSSPDGWAWSRLGEVTNYGIADKAEPEDVDEDTWVLDLEDVEKESSKLLQKTRYAEKPFQSSKNRFAKGDVIYGKLRPYLDKVIVADEGGVCTTEMIPLRGYADISPFYLRLVMKTPHFIKYADDSTHGMNLPRLGTDRARMALFPIAPYNEQHRIVAKVDELMALCDQLEQQQTHSIEAHQTLVETLLGTLTRVASQQELTEAWTHIANHFDTLFITDHSIDQLKQTILQLAVMGKLVPQDPNDEPACELLSRKQDSAEENIPFRIPESWVWARVDGFAQTRLGKMLDKAKNKGTPVRYLRNVNVRWFDFDLSDVKEMRFEDSELEEFSLRRGDVLICEGGYPGRAAVWDERESNIYFQKAIHRVRFQNGVNPNYFVYVLRESADSGRLNSYFTGAGIQHFTGKGLASFLVPLPPLPEQHRIVAKVDELMALCDALKARLADAKTTQIHLADAIVEQAVA